MIDPPPRFVKCRSYVQPLFTQMRDWSAYDEGARDAT
jgi:hypothetical protein